MILGQGAIFAEKYEILECLSSGTQAIVYKALQKPLDRVVILKTLFPALTANTEIVARFEREAKLLSTLKEEHVAKIYDYGKHNGVYFFVTEYIEGLSVKELIERKGRLSSHFASYIILESAKILARLHNQGIIHRDLKPGNILLGQDGKIKLTDFGLALSQAMPSITIEGSIMGTPTYMSPEQILGKPVDNRSDIYSLGVVFYELLTGTNPFLGETYSAIMHNVLNLKPTAVYKTDKTLEDAKDLWLIIEQMIGKSPYARFENISDVSIKLDLRFNKPENKKWKLDTKDWQSDEKLSSLAIKPPKSKSKIKRWLFVPITVILLIIVLLAVSKIRNNKPLVLQSFQPALGGSTESIVQTQTDNLTTNSTKLTDNITIPKLDTGEPIIIKPEVPAIANQNNKGFLKVSVVPWATVFIDGKEVFTTPKDTSLEMSAGQHNIKLINPGFPIIESIISIQPNRNMQCIIDLTERVSYLQVSVQPWADIYIDGIFKATTPISAPLILPGGVHRITLKNPYFQPYEETITFEPKKIIERNIILK